MAKAGSRLRKRKVPKIEFGEDDTVHPVEKRLQKAGYWCFYNGPLILGLELQDLFPLYGKACIAIHRIVVESADKNGRSFRVHVKAVEVEKPDDKEGKLVNEYSYLNEGEAVHVMYEQVLTIHGPEIRLWAPKSEKPAKAK
jgi:hypothetical protein